MSKHRAQSRSLQYSEIFLCALAISCLAAALFWAVPAPFSIDGFIYWMMVDAFVRDYSLFVQNGYPEYKADALRLALNVWSGDRLAPQYPGGWGILASPVYQLAGLRGVVFANALASILTLALIWLTARRLFRDRAVAGYAAIIYALATFAVEYAFGIWPHAIATFFVSAAVYATARHWKGESLTTVFLAGVAIGVGVNIRADVILVLPAIAVFLLGTSSRPYWAIGLLFAGAAPGLICSSVINAIKFGTWSPLSYGSSAGATSLAHYAELVMVATVCLIACLGLGSKSLRALVYRPAIAVGVILFLGSAVFLVPKTHDLVLRAAEGFWVLVVDFQHFAKIDHPTFRISDVGLSIREDGAMLVFGSLKKSLVQSMPFLAVTIILFPHLLFGERRAPIAFGLLIFMAIVSPFSISAWHGGMANNMRYFFHAVPILAILTAVAIVDLRKLSGIGDTLPFVGSLALIGGILALDSRLNDYFLQAQLPVLLAGAIAIFAVATVALRGRIRAAVAYATQFLVFLAFAVSFHNAYFYDLQRSTQVRSANLAGAELSAALPSDAAVVTFVPEALALRVNRPPGLTVLADFRTGEFELDTEELLMRVQDEGRPVFAHGQYLADAIVAIGAASRAEAVIDTPRGRLFRMIRPD